MGCSAPVALSFTHPRACGLPYAEAEQRLIEARFARVSVASLAAQKLRAEVERRAGGLLALASFIEASERYARGQLTSEEFEPRLRATFR